LQFVIPCGNSRKPGLRLPKPSLAYQLQAREDTEATVHFVSKSIAKVSIRAGASLLLPCFFASGEGK